MMTRRYVIHFIATLLVAVSVLLPATPALAATNPFSDACSGAGRRSAVCTTGRTDPLSSTIRGITKVVASLAGVAAVIVMIVSGIRYITSNGDAEAVAKSKRILILAAVGLLIIVVGQALITLVISKV